MPEQEFLTYEEVAAELTRFIGSPCSAEWVRWLGKRGRIAVIKFSKRRHRISRQALDTYLKTCQEADRGEGQGKGEKANQQA